MAPLIEPWWKRSTVYQIYPRSFMDSNGDGIGDIQGIILKLPYLKKLGINVIWLSPIYDSPNDDNGYDIRNYESIMSEFGTMEDFEQLIDKAKQLGIRIVMDLVVNHTSDEHYWFIESRASKDSKYRDYYIWREGEGDSPPNNWGSVFSGSAWEKDQNTNSYYLHLFSKKQPDLNWEYPLLRNDIYEMMTYWLEKGIGGFRMDVINFISKDASLPDGEIYNGQLYGDGSTYYINGPNIHTYLQEMNDKVLSQYDVLTVGEMPGTNTDEAKVYTNPSNREINMIFTFEHMDLDHGPYEKWDSQPFNLVKLKKIFEKWQTALYNKGWNSLYWNNHDQPRVVSRFGCDNDKYREKSAKMLAICLHMLQGTPYIYQGEEFGMTNVKFESIEDYRDIETLNMYKEKRNQGMPLKNIMASIYSKGRDNARTPMQWTAEGGFSTGTAWINMNPNVIKINAENALKNNSSIFYTYQKLIEIRKECDIITYGKFQLLLAEHENLFVYKRIWKNQEWLIVSNFSEKTEFLDLSLCKVENTNFKVIIANEDCVKIDENMLEVSPFEALVLSFERGLHDECRTRC